MHLATAFALLFAATPSTDSPSAAVAMPDPIAKRMREIILPRVEFENAELGDVIEYLRMKTIAHDRRKGGDRDGINFMLLAPPPQGGAAEPPADIPRVTLSLRGASLHETLTKACAMAGFRWKAEASGIVMIRPAGDPAPEKRRPLPREMNDTQRDVLGRLRQTIIPNLHVRDAAIEDVIAFLRQASIDHSPEKDPAKRGLAFIIKAAPDAEEATISLRLKKIPMIEGHSS